MVNYEEIFKTYLNFCPYYRRRLYTLIEIYDWLQTADLILPSMPRNDKDSVFVFLDFLYRNKLITPFFSKGVKARIFGHWIGEEWWRQAYKKDFIRFWDDDKLRESGLMHPYSFNGIEERKVDLYFFHPLQIVQIMSFLVKMMRKCYNIFQFEDFYHFYIKRMSEIKNEHYKIVKVTPFYPITLIKSLNFAKWLKPEWLRLYIKLEKIDHIDLYSSGHTNDCRIILVDNDAEYEEGNGSSKVENWFQNFEVEKKTHFTDKELHELQYFTSYMKDISDKCDGLKQWSDLFCLIKNNKEKLKSIVLYDVNLIQITNDLNRLLWYLRTDDVENAEDRPADYFVNYVEAEKHYQKVLYKYNLTPEPLFIVYVEGSTEINILKKWYKMRGYYHSFGFKKLLSKNEKDIKRTLDYVVKAFKSKIYFYFFDGDDNDPQNKKIKDLFHQFNIKEERYEFFEPDFVTHNFSDDEIINALDIYLEDDDDLSISQEDLKEIRKKIKDGYDNGVKIENTIDEIFDVKHYGSFSKKKFGKFLGEIVINEIKKEENRKIFPFEDIFYKRFYPIAEAFLKKKVSH